jgi:hypothetical protein
MNVILIKVKIDNYRIIIRILNILLIFSGLFYVGEFKYLDNIDFWIYLSIFWSLFYFFQLTFIKPYKKVGIITLDVNKLEIQDYDKNVLTFYPSDKLNIYLKYRGYEKEPIDSRLGPLVIYTIRRIGKLKIMKNHDLYEFYFISEQNNNKLISKILYEYEQKGNVIEIKGIEF